MTDPSMEGVDIIILNYKNWQDTISCLDSVFLNDYTNFNVIVVDNASNDGSVDNIISWAKGKIESQVPDFIPIQRKVQKPIDYHLITDANQAFINKPLTIIAGKENLGYAGGNNVGLRYAQASTNRYKWIINNDTYILPSALSELVTFFKTDKSLGLLGCKLLFFHSPDKIQAIGGKFNKITGTTSHIGENHQKNDFSDSNYPIDYPIGAAIFTSNEFLAEVGLMCEDYFLYFEEIDWAIRAKKAGYKIGFCPKSIVYHKEGATIGLNHIKKEKSEFADYWSLRNRIILSKKYNRLFLPMVYLSFSIVIVNRLKRKQFNRIPKILKILFTHEVN